MALLIGVGLFLHHNNLAVLNPKGPIAFQERKLIIKASLLSLIVVVPVFIMTFAFAWKYREGNKHAKYRPELDHHLGAEIAWWTIPSVIILVLSVIAWHSSHSLDPYNLISTNGVRPLKVQVVSLDWKWLFIYPDQKIASLNLLEIPVNTPINFEITSDAPMNSFWIPQLGSQIYSMPGMKTNLSLMADHDGDYHGSSANMSGAGFAEMNFIARTVRETEFSDWAKQVKKSHNVLSLSSYNVLAMPSQHNPVVYYKLADINLLNEVLNKYTQPAGQPMSNMMNMSGGIQ